MIGVATDDVLAAVPNRRGYDVARRHSARVRFLKLAIPVGSAAAVGLVVLATLYNPFGKISGLTLGSLSLSGSKIAMQGPRLTRFRKDARPYEVTATAAYQDVTKPTVIELKDMKANLAIDDAGGMAHLVSTLGVFDTTKEHLELSKDIRITTDRGDEILLKSASVDLKGGTAQSREPLKITTANGVIEAEGMDISDNGRTISFTGRVRTQFDRSLATSGAGPASKASAAKAPGTSRYTDAAPGR